MAADQTPPGRILAAAEAEETIRILSGLGPGSTAGEILSASLQLTRLFGDTHSLRYYAGLVRQIQRGELPARIPIAAVQYARGAGIRRPAAAFTSHIERCRAVRESRSKRPVG